ncbi:hypothetical protein [Vibrio sp. YIC-376]|uniref:hypothetical protein n=1 Tax=Vibrio sp. YIC-376 TaxID=3136162 RepID=UPI00402AC8B6
MNSVFLYDEIHHIFEDVGMLTFNRTLLLTLTCLVAMLLTSLSPKVQASTIPLEQQSVQSPSEAVQAQLGVNSDCIQSQDSKHTLKPGKEQQAGCSSSCIVKVPMSLPLSGLILLPYRLALIQRPPAVKAVTVVYEPYRPPIV